MTEPIRAVICRLLSLNMLTNIPSTLIVLYITLYSTLDHSVLYTKSQMAGLAGLVG